MKKRIYLLIFAAMLMLLTACNPGQTQEESGTGAEQEISGAEAGADGTETSAKM